MAKILGVENALIIFVDIIDSTKYCSVLGFEKYAKIIMYFQQIFDKLGNKYFQNALNFKKIDSRGDEGIVFIIDKSEKCPNLIFRAITFLFDLKGRLAFIEEETGIEKSPCPIGIGAGIHIGDVACISEKKDNKECIDRIEGYSINYTKRVETCSRYGKDSRIFLSKDAARLLEGEPIVFNKIVAPMKGIEEQAEVYEVKSGYFEDFIFDLDGSEEKYLFKEVTKLANNPEKIKEPWLKSFTISVLEFFKNNSSTEEEKEEYEDLKLKLAWHSIVEDDPVLLFIRSLEYRRQNEYTQQIRYLKMILEKYPDFTHARKQLVEACYEIYKSKLEWDDKLYARDMAIEFLERHKSVLTEEEIEKYYRIKKELNTS